MSDLCHQIAPSQIFDLFIQHFTRHTKVDTIKIGEDHQGYRRNILKTHILKQYVFTTLYGVKITAVNF